MIHSTKPERFPGRYERIEDDIIDIFGIDICDGTKCKDGDWSRTHAHIKQRRVCKWKRANSVRSLFTLLHEIGHIENNTSDMRRCEQEWAATMWALDRCRELGVKVPEKIIKEYQDYIDEERRRGEARGATFHGSMNLV